MSIQVTIGTAPCSWGVWWPDGTPSRTPYNVFLDQAAQAGYKTLELGPVGYLPTDVEQLRDELDSRGLSICGGTACYEFLKASSFADVRKDVDDLCKRLLAFDVHYMMSMDGTAFAPGEKDKLTEAKKRTFGIFAEMGRYCRETYGVEVLMHPERRSLIETPEELEELIDLGLSICYDNGHFAAASEATALLWIFWKNTSTGFPICISRMYPPLFAGWNWKAILPRTILDRMR